GSDKLWRMFCPLVGRPEIAADPRFVTNAARNANRAALVAILDEAFQARSFEEWEAILQPAGIPVGAINTIEQVVAHPQVAARGAIGECRHPTAGVVKTVGPPVRMSATPGRVRRPAPRIGEHTADVLRERLGLDADTLARLRRDRVIR